MNMSSFRKYGRYSMNLAMEQERLQGWLSVANVVDSDCVDQLEWHRRYCVLEKDERTLYFYNDTESVPLTGRHSPVKFTLSGGDDAQDGQCLSTKTTLSLLDPNYVAASSGNSSNFQRGTRQSRSLRDKVRSSLQKTVKKSSLAVRGEDRSAGGSVRVSRSKSFGKNDHIINSQSNPAGMKLGSSMENLIIGGRMDEGGMGHFLGQHGTHLDLATKGLLNIAPVHQSISPRHSCFRILTESEVLYASCGSREELDRWVTGLTECHSPNRNHVRRVDSYLAVWILEARALPPKKRYYCELSLNGVLYSRTCCKLMNDSLFWGEPFQFQDLPLLGTVTVKVCRENYNKKKKERSDTDIGKIEIPAIVLQKGQVNEKWYPITGFSAGGSKTASSSGRSSDIPSVRIKLQYKTVSIMPLKVYDEFLQYLKTDYGTMCEVLEPVIPAKAKDDIATTLVRILQREGKAREFICDVIMSEVQAVENENLIFRGNTFATKAVDTYMKMVGVTYLRDTLAPFTHTLMDEYGEEECEVDPTKLSNPASLAQNQANLTTLVSRAWADILKSYNRFPSDLQVTLNSIRQRFGPEREEACFKLISGSIFLRFFCPAILSPSLFSLCQEYPDEKIARKLTLVAKVIQNLANFARFGVKEEYMCFMNEFLGKEIKNMKQFIDTISSPLVGNHIVPWGPQRIDLGREASVMHISLTNLLSSIQLSPSGSVRIETLTRLLREISQAGEEDASDPFTSTFEALRVMKTSISKLNTVILPPSDRSGYSDTSPEYTTPVQSQTTSPTREPSPSSVGPTDSSMLKGLQALGLADEQSPLSSPNLSGGGSMSSLATHTNRAVRREKTRTLPISSRNSGPSGGGGDSLESRRLSDSALQRLGIHKVGPEVHSSGRKTTEAFTMEDTVEVAELCQEVMQLRQENSKLVEGLERLKLHNRVQQETAEREMRRLHAELARYDNTVKRMEQNFHESRGKLFKGLNTQTEVALVQLTRDFENMRTQLLAKDEIIGVQENKISIQDKKIASLLEANGTLRAGLQDLLSLPKERDTESEDEEEGGGETRHHSRSGGEGGVPNGHPVHPSPRAHSADLYRMISLLDSGKFDQS